MSLKRRWIAGIAAIIGSLVLGGMEMKAVPVVGSSNDWFAAAFVLGCIIIMFLALFLPETTS